MIDYIQKLSAHTKTHRDANRVLRYKTSKVEEWSVLDRIRRKSTKFNLPYHRNQSWEIRLLRDSAYYFVFAAKTAHQSDLPTCPSQKAVGSGNKEGFLVMENISRALVRFTIWLEAGKLCRWSDLRGHLKQSHTFQAV